MRIHTHTHTRMVIIIEEKKRKEGDRIPARPIDEHHQRTRKRGRGGARI